MKGMSDILPAYFDLSGQFGGNDELFSREMKSKESSRK